MVKKYEVINFGRGGRTASIYTDHPYIYNPCYSISLASKPDIVIIMLGTNDAKFNNWNEDRFVKYYSSLC